MKLVNRISVYFNRLDSAYSDLYEKQLAFEENPTFRTSEELKESVESFKLKYFAYKTLVKDLYFKN